MEGQELGEEEKIWREVATSEARLALMKNMVREQLAFTDLEEFGIIFDNKLKSKKLKIQDRVPISRLEILAEIAWRDLSPPLLYLNIC